MKGRGAVACFALALAAWVMVPAAAQAQLDHYKCYQGKDLKLPKFAPLKCKDNTGVDTTDEIVSAGECVDVKKIAYVCIPVSKDDGPINDPSAYLICYLIKGQTFPAGSRPKVQVSTQFQISQLELKKPKLLCVPGGMEVLSP